MKFCPETFPIVEGHEPVASNALADTSDAVKLVNARGVFILVHEDYAVDATGLVLTVHEGATATEAEAGTYAIATAFPIWLNSACETNDTWVRQTDAITHTIDYTAGNNVMVGFYIPASILTAGREWIQLGASSGNAGNIVAVTYIMDVIRFGSVTPPTSMA